MKQSPFNNVNLSSFAKRKEYPSTDIAMQALRYKNERLDYWFTKECECPYTEAAKDVENKFGHMMIIK